MVINNDPCYAYLLEGNADVDQKLVMAHVYGHVDFFKNNFFFSNTNRKMIDEMANHATRVRRYMDKLGEDEGRGLHRPLPVAREPDRLHRCRRHVRAPPKTTAPAEEDAGATRSARFRAKEYMDDYINPPEFLEAQQRRSSTRKQRASREVPRASPSATCCCS